MTENIVEPTPEQPEKKKRLSPKRAKFMYRTGVVLGELSAQGLNAAIYGVFSFLLSLGVNVGFHDHVRWYGVWAILYPGAWLAKIVIKDLSRAHGRAVQLGQADAFGSMMATQAKLQAAQAKREAEAASAEESAIRRAMEMLGRPDDPPMGAYL